MSHALAIPSTPLWRFLSGEPYVSRGPIPDVGLVTGAERLMQIRQHYFDKVTTTRQSEVLQEQFQALAKDWREATQFLSSLSRITTHLHYRAIINLGQDVVPLLLRELEVRPSLWFTALREISGANPVRPEDRGHIDKMAQAWLQWGKEQGLSW